MKFLNGPCTAAILFKKNNWHRSKKGDFYCCPLEPTNENQPVLLVPQGSWNQLVLTGSWETQVLQEPENQPVLTGSWENWYLVEPASSHWFPRKMVSQNLLEPANSNWFPGNPGSQGPVETTSSHCFSVEPWFIHRARFHSMTIHFAFYKLTHNILHSYTLIYVWSFRLLSSASLRLSAFPSLNCF